MSLADRLIEMFVPPSQRIDWRARYAESISARVADGVAADKQVERLRKQHAAAVAAVQASLETERAISRDRPLRIETAELYAERAQVEVEEAEAQAVALARDLADALVVVREAYTLAMLVDEGHGEGSEAKLKAALVLEKARALPL